MIVGTCLVTLRIFQSKTLKEKRSIVKSIIGKCKSRFNISISEVGDFELWQKSQLGIACVSNQTTHVEQILDTVVRFIENNGEVEVIHIEMDIYR